MSENFDLMNKLKSSEKNELNETLKLTEILGFDVRETLTERKKH